MSAHHEERGEATGPVVRLCREEDVAAASRAYGLAVVREDDPDGLHDPRCGGCEGRKTSEDCRFSVKQRMGMARLGFDDDRVAS